MLNVYLLFLCVDGCMQNADGCVPQQPRPSFVAALSRCPMFRRKINVIQANIKLKCHKMCSYGGHYGRDVQPKPVVHFRCSPLAGGPRNEIYKCHDNNAKRK